MVRCNEKRLHSPYLPLGCSAEHDEQELACYNANVRVSVEVLCLDTNHELATWKPIQSDAYCRDKKHFFIEF
jgi:hypothetical protein